MIRSKTDTGISGSGFLSIAEVNRMPWQSASMHIIEAECCFHNAATCPDCGSGMIRLGACFSCPGCGFESCSL